MTTVSPIKDFIAGGVGGSCVVLSGHPLDTIKVRLQTQSTSNPLYKGTWDCAVKTVKLEGVRGLYKGMAAPLMAVSPIFSMSFLGFGLGKRVQMSSPDQKLSNLQLFNAGCLSGAFTTTVMTPGERVKCLLQVQKDAGTRKYAGPVAVVRDLGLRGLYRGTCATLLRDVPASGMFFLAYEYVKAALAPPPSPGGEAPPLSPLRTMAAGGIAGLANWIVAIGPDVLKSRLQTAPEGTYPHGIRSVFADIMRKEGPSALFRGLAPVMIRAFPANAACFLGYEAALKALNNVAPDL